MSVEKQLNIAQMLSVVETLSAIAIPRSLSVVETARGRGKNESPHL